MVHRRLIRGLAALALLATMVACGDDDEGSSATTTPGDEGAAADGSGQAVDLTAIDYGYENVPDDLSAGLVELSFANDGKVDHEAAFVEIGDTPLDQFLQDFPPVLEGGPFPAYAEDLAVPIEIPGGEDGEATFLLAEGTYALLCALTGDAEAPPAPPGEDPVEGAPHYTKGMATTVEVGAGDAAAELPAADGTITALDYDFEPDIEAGDTTINFVNQGPKQVHFASVSVFPEGTDVAAAEEAFAALLALDEDTPPPEGVPLPEDVGFSGVFSADLGGQFTLPDGFESGRTYVLACFIQDREGGPPHAIGQQMYKTFTVE